MLFLLFQLGNDRYALDATQIVEVLPLVQLKQVPQAPAGLAGLLNYRGAAVPVVDLSQLALGRASAPRLSTRLIMARRGGADGSLLALVAEQATETLRCDAAEFVSSGFADPDTAYLGPVRVTQGRIVQRVEIDKLLTPAMLACLDSTAAPAS
ncbi:chemotaxis protein CheW [Tahibacter amnicola]|uniref:Chemotaxis protein CheW n=1 Tax=Tahibacter amnicola TaxID=2976241 RepID=A0ABY6BFN0_9GAMM|nr:chemotaxis protein CheW [Tahibacter amnicola]UXI68597.1 chemotaxis protein CheW [Tahibacter amnicola]